VETIGQITRRLDALESRLAALGGVSG